MKKYTVSLCNDYDSCESIDFSFSDFDDMADFMAAAVAHASNGSILVSVEETTE